MNNEIYVMEFLSQFKQLYPESFKILVQERDEYMTMFLWARMQEMAIERIDRLYMNPQSGMKFNIIIKKWKNT